MDPDQPKVIWLEPEHEEFSIGEWLIRHEQEALNQIVRAVESRREGTSLSDTSSTIDASLDRVTVGEELLATLDCAGWEYRLTRSTGVLLNEKIGMLADDYLDVKPRRYRIKLFFLRRWIRKHSRPIEWANRFH